MALINVSVVCGYKYVLPWKITSATFEKESVQEYYEALSAGTAVLNGLILNRAYLGPSKDSLDLVDLGIELNQAITMFGHYLKFIVEKNGAPLQELEMSAELKELVFVRNLQCNDPIECLYYTAKYEPKCIYCALPASDNISKTTYPQCEQCNKKPAISRKLH